MRNRLLVITRNTIPYVKELRPVTKSVAGCILMQQLEYWFARYPDGFYKFMEPCSHRAYKSGQSWAEELAITPDEFRSAFDHIATRYRTRAEFEAAADKFQGKFYCSFLDKRDGITYYYRNHQAVDAFLDGLVLQALEAPTGTATYPDGNSNLPDGNSGLPRLAPPLTQMEIPVCTDGNSNLPRWESPSPQVDIPVCPDGDSPLIKDITTETTQRLPKTTTNTPPPPKAAASPKKSVVVPHVNEDSIPEPTSVNGFARVDEIVGDPTKAAGNIITAAARAARVNAHQPDESIVKALTDVDVGENVAICLASQHDAVGILRRIAAWNRGKGAFGNTVGALVRAIECEWNADAKYEAQVKQEKGQSALDNMAQRRKQQEDRESVVLLAAWKCLPDKDKEAVRKEALRRVSQNARENPTSPVYAAVIDGAIISVMAQTDTK